MSIKLKALGLGLIAALAMSAFAVMSASATTGGHFISEQAHTLLKGSDEAANPTKFIAFGQTVTCKKAVYHGTTTNATETEQTITPTYSECTHSLGTAHVNMNGCDYLFTVRANPDVNDNTVHLVCTGAQGPTIQVTGPFGNCKIEVTPNQTPAGGVAFKTGGSGSTHDIVADATTSGIHAVITEGGGNFFVCGTTSTTTSTATLDGNATLQGFATDGTTQVGITAT